LMYLQAMRRELKQLKGSEADTRRMEKVYLFIYLQAMRRELKQLK
jgi:hypothetical protein